MKTSTNVCTIQNLSTVTEDKIYLILFLIAVFAFIATLYLFLTKKITPKKEAIKEKNIIIGKAKKEAGKILKEAEIEKDIILKKTNTELEIIEIKEKEISKLKDSLLKENQLLQDSINDYRKLQNDLKIKQEKAKEVLEGTSHLTEEDAKKTLLDFVKNKYSDYLKEQIRIQERKWKEIAKEKSSAILLNMLSNISTSVVYEGTSNVFKLNGPEEKAKIIGKEGRNLKAIQQILGVDVVLKYSEDEILISSFDPIRRLIASRVIKTLLDKKRLQPQAIEEEYQKVLETLDFEFYQKGLEIALQNDVSDLPDKILKMLGMLEYRTSYGQSVLKHSVEVGQISKLIATELGVDPMLAFKCGLLHDIGKAVDKSQEGTHVALGVEVLKSEKMDRIIINSVEAHHEDVKKESVYAEIVAIADAISSSRPGARNFDTESFVLKMKEIENVISEFDGVTEVYALKSGRQIRVIVNPKSVSEFDLAELAVKIKEKIKAINTTPGEIVITLIRENRHVVSF